MLSSIYMGAFALHPEVVPVDVWEMGDWFDPQMDDPGLSGLGDYNPLERNPSGPSPTDTATVTSTYSLCDPNEVLVSNPDWAAPVCMTAEMAMSYGAGLQQQRTAQASTPFLGLTGSTAQWVTVGAVVLLAAAVLGGGRRR